MAFLNSSIRCLLILSLLCAQNVSANAEPFSSLCRNVFESDSANPPTKVIATFTPMSWLRARTELLKQSWARLVHIYLLRRKPLDPEILEARRNEYRSLLAQHADDEARTILLSDRTRLDGPEAAIAWIEAFAENEKISGFVFNERTLLPRWMRKLTAKKLAANQERAMQVAKIVYLSSHGIPNVDFFKPQSSLALAENELVRQLYSLEMLRAANPGEAAVHLGLIDPIKAPGFIRRNLNLLNNNSYYRVGRTAFRNFGPSLLFTALYLMGPTHALIQFHLGPLIIEQISPSIWPYDWSRPRLDPIFKKWIAVADRSRVYEDNQLEMLGLYGGEARDKARFDAAFRFFMWASVFALSSILVTNLTNYGTEKITLWWEADDVPKSFSRRKALIRILNGESCKIWRDEGRQADLTEYNDWKNTYFPKTNHELYIQSKDLPDLAECSPATTEGFKDIPEDK